MRDPRDELSYAHRELYTNANTRCDKLQVTVVGRTKLTALATTVAKFVSVQSLGQSSTGKYLTLFWNYPNFLMTQRSSQVEESPCAKNL